MIAKHIKKRSELRGEFYEVSETKEQNQRININLFNDLTSPHFINLYWDELVWECISMVEDRRMFFIRNREVLLKEKVKGHVYEYELTTDAKILGYYTYDPYGFCIWEFADKRDGEERKLILRTEQYTASWHLESDSPEYYHGGDIPEELVALASLFLRRKIKLGPIVRMNDFPKLIGITRRWIDRDLIEDVSNLKDLIKWLELVERLDIKYHYKFILATRLYHRAILDIETQPDVAYLNLISAIEVLSNEFELDDVLENLKDNLDIELLDEIRSLDEPDLQKEFEIALLKRINKRPQQFVKFILKYIMDDDEFWTYEKRPKYWKITPKVLPELLERVYQQRSNFLHDGVPFQPDIFHPPALKTEINIGKALQDRGKKWTSEEFIPYPHFFERLINHVLKNFLKKNQVEDPNASQDVINPKKMNFINNKIAVKDPSMSLKTIEYEVVTDADLKGECVYEPYFLTQWDYTEKIPGEERKLCYRIRLGISKTFQTTGRSEYEIVNELVILSSLFLRRRLILKSIVRVNDDPKMYLTPEGGVIRRWMDKSLIIDETKFDELRDWFNLIEGLNDVHHWKFMLATKFYHQAVLVIEEQPDLTYVNLVSAIEPLCQDMDIGEVTLADLGDQNIERLVNSVGDVEKREKLKNLFLARERFISRHFIKFILAHVNDDFWNDEKRLGYAQVKPEDLETFLKRIYAIRSQYLHQGIPFPTPLMNPPQLHPLAEIGGEELFEREKDHIPNVHFFEKLVNHVLLEFLKNNSGGSKSDRDGY